MFERGGGRNVDCSRLVQAQTIEADERGKPYGLLPISLPTSVRDWLYF
jgi:hypothetical protein